MKCSASSLGGSPTRLPRYLPRGMLIIRPACLLQDSARLAAGAVRAPRRQCRRLARPLWQARMVVLVGYVAFRAGLAGATAATRIRPVPWPLRVRLAHPGGVAAAGASGFLDLIHSRERPERYVEPLRLLTIPSSPILQAWRNTISPSWCSRWSFSRTPGRPLRRMLARVALRTSMGSRRRSAPGI